MRILIVSQYFWPESFRINDLAAGLVERGHDVTILTGIPNYPSGDFFDGYGLLKRRHETYAGARIIRVPMLARGKNSKVRLSLNYLSYVFSAVLLGPLLCRQKYDVAIAFQTSPITQALPAFIFKMLRGTKVMLWVQDLWPESLSATGAVRSPALLGLVGSVVRWVYKRSDLILVQSRAFMGSTFAYGAQPAQLRYFPNTAESFYQPVAVPADAKERGLLPDGFRVMFAGNIGIAQDFATILSAAEKLKDMPEIKWVIIGDGSRSAWVRSEVKARGLEGSVHLIGSFPPETMPTFFALADALLMTLTRDEIFSLVIPSKLQSYIACGKPVVAGIDGEGARVVEEAGAGMACPSGSPDELAAIVLRLYQATPEERALMGQRGRQYFLQHFERERALDQLEGWMSGLAPAAAHRPACAEGGAG